MWGGPHRRLAADTRDILPHRTGTTIHNGWATYREYPGNHGPCNAHYDREITAAEDATHQDWVASLRHLLSGMKAAADVARQRSARTPSRPLHAKMLTLYDQYIQEGGLRQNPERILLPGRKRHPA